MAAMRADVRSDETPVARRALSLFVRVVRRDRLVIPNHEPALVWDLNHKFAGIGSISLPKRRVQGFLFAFKGLSRSSGWTHKSAGSANQKQKAAESTITQKQPHRCTIPPSVLRLVGCLSTYRALLGSGYRRKHGVRVPGTGRGAKCGVVDAQLRSTRPSIILSLSLTAPLGRGLAYRVQEDTARTRVVSSQTALVPHDL